MRCSGPTSSGNLLTSPVCLCSPNTHTHTAHARFYCSLLFVICFVVSWFCFVFLFVFFVCFFFVFLVLFFFLNQFIIFLFSYYFFINYINFPPSKGVREVVLRAGDCFYHPAGLWHCVVRSPINTHACPSLPT